MDSVRNRIRNGDLVLAIYVNNLTQMHWGMAQRAMFELQAMRVVLDPEATIWNALCPRGYEKDPIPVARSHTTQENVNG